MMTIEQDIRTFLLTSIATSTCSSSFTFIGPMRPSVGGFPVEAVSIHAYGGLTPYGFIAGNSRKTQLKTDVQVRVRGAVNDFIGAQNRAYAVWHTLNRPDPASVSTGSTAYSIIQPIQSGPTFIGLNDTQQPEFTFSVRCWAIQGT